MVYRPLTRDIERGDWAYVARTTHFQVDFTDALANAQSIWVFTPTPTDNRGPLVAAGSDATGNSATLDLSTSALADHAVFVVRATKQHLPVPIATAAPDASTIPSETWLEVPQAVLLEPDTTWPLVVRVLFDAAGPTAEIVLASGEPGVGYGIATDQNQLASAPMGHFYDELEDGTLIGVGGLVIDLDLVVAGESLLNPRIMLESLSAGTRFTSSPATTSSEPRCSGQTSWMYTPFLRSSSLRPSSAPPGKSWSKGATRSTGTRCARTAWW